MSHPRVVRPAHMFTAFAALALGCGGGDAASDADASVDVDAGGSATDGGPPDAGGSRIDRILALLTQPDASRAAIDAELLAAAREAAWPLHEGGRWLFARPWDGAPADAAVTGEWVDFAAGALPATEAAIGGYVYRLVDEGAGDVAPQGLYKWWSSAGGYQAPPEATVYGYDDFGEYGRVAPPDQAHLQRFPGFAAAGLAPRTIRVRVPAFGAAQRVLVLHDGQNVFDPDAFFGGWHADDALAVGAYGDVLGVAVDNTADRFDEYTQVADTIGGVGTVGGDADAYWTLIDDEVLPFVRSRFGVAASTDDVAVVGSSLGGLISLYGAMTTPTRARCTIGMSATLGWGSIGPDTNQALVETWATTAPASVVLTMGGDGGACADSDGDGVEDDIDQGDNYCETRQLQGVLEALGYQAGDDLAVIHTPGAQHNEAAWAAVLPDALAACAAMGW